LLRAAGAASDQLEFFVENSQKLCHTGHFYVSAAGLEN
jgi:hypothetical protein